jgi:nicotinamidase-related amidase
MYSLVLIDLQTEFLEQLKDLGKNVMSNCTNLIREAINDNAKIILVEYIGFGFTTPEIKLQLSNYHYDVVCKERDDGSLELKDFFNENKLNPSKVKIAGIFSNQCVRETVVGLLETTKYNIEVCKNAIDSWSVKHNNEAVRYFDYCGKMGMSIQVKE